MTFGKRTPKDTPPQEPPSGGGDAPGAASLAEIIKERSKDDPLFGAKAGAKDIFQRLLALLKNERGVHIETLLCVLGSLAGYSCQASLRAQAIAKGLHEEAAFVVVEDDKRTKYFFGNPLNELLAEARMSVWSLAGGAAQQAGGQLLDVNEIFAHVSKVIGHAQFGIPRLPEKHRPQDLPVNFVKAIWPAMLPTVKAYCADPVLWPILLGLAIQEAITMGKTVIEPSMALKIVMECAVPMSKIDLANTEIRRA
jgi:hypothetical protein